MALDSKEKRELGEQWAVKKDGNYEFVNGWYVIRRNRKVNAYVGTWYTSSHLSRRYSTELVQVPRFVVNQLYSEISPFSISLGAEELPKDQNLIRCLSGFPEFSTIHSFSSKFCAYVPLVRKSFDHSLIDFPSRLDERT